MCEGTFSDVAAHLRRETSQSNMRHFRYEDSDQSVHTRSLVRAGFFSSVAQGWTQRKWKTLSRLRSRSLIRVLSGRKFHVFSFLLRITVSFASLRFSILIFFFFGIDGKNRETVT